MEANQDGQIREREKERQIIAELIIIDRAAIEISLKEMPQLSTNFHVPYI